MRKSLILLYTFCVLSICIQAQNSFFYQSVLRNPEGAAIAHKNIQVRFSIIADGNNTVYSEVHQTKTDVNGYVVLYIGEGTPGDKAFSQINWSEGRYRVKTEIDKGEGYALAGTQDLVSVPYAMQAEVAGGIQQKSPDGTTWNIMADDNGGLTAIPIPTGYSKLVFNDEFSGTGFPDSKKWNFEEGYVRNGEMQYYTIAREENCFQKDGYLHLICENKPVFIPNAKVNKQWEEWKERRKDTIVSVTSSSITTRGLNFWKYCRVDVRAKLPMCKGTWPAIWMMPQYDVYGGWPRSGEIDIMEHVGYAPEDVHFTLHCVDHNSEHWPNLYNKTVYHPTSYTQFHVYSLVWTETRISWYLDGRLRFYVSRPDGYKPENWPFDQDFYLILNQAFGGGWGGREGVDLNGLPQEYQIDYVRVYQ